MMNSHRRTDRTVEQPGGRPLLNPADEGVLASRSRLPVIEGRDHRRDEGQRQHEGRHQGDHAPSAPSASNVLPSTPVKVSRGT